MFLNENRAAQYVRMSTGMQRYSIANQSEAIAIYAARRGLTIVRSYEDAARSGLHLDGREALKNLLDDVRLGRADFEVILVYDVSRWGRFQDSDESAASSIFLTSDGRVILQGRTVSPQERQTLALPADGEMISVDRNLIRAIKDML